MFASHERILADQVMDLYVQMLDTWTATPGTGPSYPAPMTADLVDVVPPHEHTGETESDEENSGDIEGGSSGSGDDEFVSTTSVGNRFLLPAPLPAHCVTPCLSKCLCTKKDKDEDNKHVRLHQVQLVWGAMRVIEKLNGTEWREVKLFVTLSKFRREMKQSNVTHTMPIQRRVQKWVKVKKKSHEVEKTKELETENLNLVADQRKEIEAMWAEDQRQRLQKSLLGVLFNQLNSEKSWNNC
ncbi:hypothetical protein PIB30_080337 [Stylosanthes scabra]|uniref:Uncharacterized protein n=1 Tax=Stylosanthes scabra TaxID=79078 RepID=A0ABU6RS53_9FABA|nr:hypothetical protein [Stylosanthes scabra]